MISIALLALMNIQQADQTITDAPCEPARLFIVSKIEPNLYEARIANAWPAVLKTKTIDFNGSGNTVIFARKIGIKNLPTNNGFTQAYIIIEQCPPNDTWGDK